MPLTLHPVTHASEFDALVRCECLSYDSPSTTFFRLFYPNPSSPHGFAELRERQIRDFETDPTARWFKIVDTDLEGEEGGGVIAGAKWNVFVENPYGEGPWAYPVAEAEWWEPGTYGKMGRGLFFFWIVRADG